MKLGKKLDPARLRPVCAAVLATLTAVTAVWMHSALAARSQEKIYEAEVEEKKDMTYVLPAGGALKRIYSPETPLWSETLSAYETHEGIDLAGGANGMVFACADGQVIAAGERGTMGMTVVIEHEEGAYSLYASLGSVNVQAGRKVRAGEVIGRVGTSAVAERELGAHVHFSFYRGEEIAPPPFTTEEY